MSLDVKAIKESFSQIDPNQFLPKFYQNLFTDFPATKKFFAETDMNHMYKALGGSLKFVVDNLENQERLVTYLKALGKRHDMSGVKAEQYGLVGQTLIKTFSESLKEKWTPYLITQWTNAFQVIAQTMTSETPA